MLTFSTISSPDLNIGAQQTGLFIALVNVVAVVVKFSLPIIESISKVFSNVYTAAFKFSV